MKGNRNFRKKVSMVTAVICTASSLPFAALADEGAGDNFNLDGTLPIVKNADEMDPIEIAIVVPPERTVPTEDLVMVKKMVEDTGIPIKWVEIPSDGSTEKINLMLNSGDYPDVFWNGITSDIAIQYSDQDLFVPTEDRLINTAQI